MTREGRRYGVLDAGLKPQPQDSRVVGGCQLVMSRFVRQVCVAESADSEKRSLRDAEKSYPNDRPLTRDVHRSSILFVLHR